MDASILKSVEAECADRLSHNAAIAAANIPVLVDPLKNIVALVTKQVETTKMVIVPLCAKAKNMSEGGPGPIFEPATVEVGVFQNPALSKASDPDPRAVAEEICSMNGLHFFKPVSIPSVICCEGYEQVPDNILNIFSCRFNFKAGIAGRFNLTKCATPVWTVGTLSLSCATAGAAIFYTTNGSRPAPRNGAIALAPLSTLASGTVVRARAFLAGYLDSNELKFTV